MQDAALQSLFAGRHGFFLISSGEYAEPPVIDHIQAGQPGTYPAGWVGLSATSAETLADLKISESESDWAKFDRLDTLCVTRQYISLSIPQVSMTREVFERSFGAGSWDPVLGAWRAAGKRSLFYRSLLVCFFSNGRVMAVYFARVKFLPGEAMLIPSRTYFLTVPVAGYVQEPLDSKASKYAIYTPRDRKKV